MKSHWFIDVGAFFCSCRTGYNRCYTDGHNRYVHCPVCKKTFNIDTYTAEELGAGEHDTRSLEEFGEIVE